MIVQTIKTKKEADIEVAELYLLDIVAELHLSQLHSRQVVERGPMVANSSNGLHLPFGKKSLMVMSTFSPSSGTYKSSKINTAVFQG